LGLLNVRPLAGGFHAWRELGFPLEYPAGLTELKQFERAKRAVL
jgi:3-mercaptopyruvate sulfurtransferase SseA